MSLKQKNKMAPAGVISIIKSLNLGHSNIFFAHVKFDISKPCIKCSIYRHLHIFADNGETIHKVYWAENLCD